MPEEFEQAQAYIRSLQAQGYSEADIWSALRQAGWQDGQIQTMLSGQPVPAPPPPPGVAPMSVETPPVVPPSRPLPRPERGARTLLVVLVVIAALLLLFALGVGAYFLAHAPGGIPAPVPVETPAPAPPPPAGVADLPAGAGSDAALQAARGFAGEGKWDCLVVSRLANWREVEVWCRPLEEESSNYLYSVGLRWSDERGGYERAYLEIVMDPPPAPPAPEVVAGWAGRPGKAGALAAAMAGLEGDYVALTASRTRDWTRAVVWIGPMASEYGEAVTVEWVPGEESYTVTNRKELAGDEMPPEHPEIVE